MTFIGWSGHSGPKIDVRAMSSTGAAMGEGLLAGHEARAHADGLSSQGERRGYASAIRDPARGNHGNPGDSIHDRRNERGETQYRSIVAPCHLTLGMLHHRTGQAATARSELSKAVEMLSGMEMRYWAQTAQTLLSGKSERR